MCTIDVFRKQAPHQLIVSNRISSREQNSLLEKPLDSWSAAIQDFRRVPDDINANDFTVRTSLGNNIEFMRPFKEAMANYDNFYENSGSWGQQIDVSSTRMEDTRSPFQRLSDPSFAQKVKTEADSKVIFIGDIHSSFHSFIEIIQNLVERRILGDDLSINQQYYIIFLGDIFDRGPFGLDIINIIFRIKNKNFDRVLILNGNHEDRIMYNNNGTGDEIKAQLGNPVDQKLVHDLMRRLPAVIFLYFDNKIVQLCHGGIANTYSPKTFLDSNYTFDFHGYDYAPVADDASEDDASEDDATEDDQNFFGFVHKGLRWTDFSMAVRGDVQHKRGRGDIYGIHHTNSYLRQNGLSGIVRGHQDLHHVSLLPKHVVREDLSFCRLEIYDMLGLKSTHPYEQQANFFERLPVPKAFDNFSVFTTSAAVRARPKLGYYNYLELKTNQQAIQDAQTKIGRLNEDMMMGNLSVAEIVHLKTFSEGAKAVVSHDRYQRLVNLYQTLKANTPRYQALFPIFELLSYDPFTSTNTSSNTTGWRSWLPSL